MAAADSFFETEACEEMAQVIETDVCIRCSDEHLLQRLIRARHEPRLAR